jgi:hypothetical protein
VRCGRLPSVFKDGGRKGKPQSCPDFGGAHIFQLRRQPWDIWNDDVEGAVSLFQENRFGGRAMWIGGTVRVGVDAVDAVIVLGSFQTALAWIESLRSRVTWTLCQAQMGDAVEEVPTKPNGLLLWMKNSRAMLPLR